MLSEKGKVQISTYNMKEDGMNRYMFPYVYKTKHWIYEQTQNLTKGMRGVRNVNKNPLTILCYMRS